MKYTLLELTQSVLSSMDSDEVTSINDTVESQQVVEVIKTVYDDIISRGDLATNKTLFNLSESVNVNQPTIMTKPDTIERVEWIKYDCRDVDDTEANWVTLTYLPPVDFIDHMHNGPLSGTGVGSFNYLSGTFSMAFTYRTDTAPHYYTSFDDNTIFFDSHDSAVDSILQSSKSLCYGLKVTDFDKSDAFTPNLQPQQFALLLNEAKSLAWAELKQVGHEKAEQSARRNWRHLQKTRREVPNNTQDLLNNANNISVLPNFARTRGF